MGSKTEQKTTIAPPTPEEQAMMQMTTDVLLPAYLNEMGYDVQKKTVTWDESAEGQRFAAQKNNYLKQLDSLQTLPPPKDQAEQQLRQQKIAQLNTQIQNLDAKSDQQRKQNAVTYEYASTKKLTPELQDIKNKYGEASQQFKDAQSSISQREIKQEGQKNEIQQQILDKTLKVLNGDYSLNPSEKQFLDDTVGPMKQAATNAIQYIKDQAASSNKDIGSAINEFADQVKKTGMDMGDAITVLEDRVKQTGVDMKTALTEQIDMTRNLINMGLQDFTRDQMVSIAKQAATLGRSPSDPEFQREMQANVNREIERTGLQLGQYAAGQDMNIAQLTGQGMQDAANKRIQVAERTGAGLESAATSRVGLAQSTGQALMGAAQQQGQNEMQIAGQEANLRTSLATGQPAQIGVGINTEQYNTALAQQRLSNAASAINAPLSVYNDMAKERFAQPTNTTTKSGGVGAFIGGLIGTGLQAGATYASGGFSNIFSGIGSGAAKAAGGSVPR